MCSNAVPPEGANVDANIGLVTALLAANKGGGDAAEKDLRKQRAIISQAFEFLVTSTTMFGILRSGMRRAKLGEATYLLLPSSIQMASPYTPSPMMTTPPIISTLGKHGRESETSSDAGNKGEDGGAASTQADGGETFSQTGGLRTDFDIPKQLCASMARVNGCRQESLYMWTSTYGNNTAVESGPPWQVCARALLNLRKGSSSNDRAIGLVPCAIGGASLDEWQKNYSGEVGDCEGSTEAPAGTPVRASSPWSYNPGAHNLFGAMAERAEDALRDAPPGSELVGVLWFQGETDAITRDTAETYFDRFETLVQDIRGLGHPHLKIFTVAVTGATTRLPHLTAVRNAQLKAGLPGGIDGVWVTDALGLPMYPDGLHLTTEAQVKLGEAIALQVFTSSHSLEAIKAATSYREGADP
ncbi:unnamed protein product [Ascophyllum nodosum]